MTATATIVTPAEFLALLNSERGKVDSRPVVYDPACGSAAQFIVSDNYQRSHESLESVLDHMDGLGRWPYQRFPFFGITGAAGEVLERGPATAGGDVLPEWPWGADRVIEAWMDSPGHRAVLMDSRFTRVGLANAGAIWAAVLSDEARPGQVPMPVPIVRRRPWPWWWFW